MTHTLRRGLCVLAAAGTLLLGAAGAAAAAPSTNGSFHQSTAAPHPAANPAACPTPAQRVKTASSPAIYLVGPDATANWIPTTQDYINLWDTWGGIYTVTDATMTSCFGGFWTMSNAHLAKVTGNSKTYIYDVNHGGYRWITGEPVFDKYAFAWDKVKTQASVSPVSSQDWNN